VSKCPQQSRRKKSEYRQMTELSDEGARKDLKDITQKKVLKIKGKGRSISYVLTGD